MGRILRPIAGAILICFAALWAAVVFITTVEGVITMPENISPTRAAMIGILQWLANSPPVTAYFLAVLMLALGFGVLFWHPEKGWAFYFEKSSPLQHSPITKIAENTVKSSSTKAREFVTKPVEQLFLIFKDHNDLQAKQLFSVYVGLWIKVEGKLGMMSEHKDGFFLQLSTGLHHDSTDVMCHGISKDEKMRLMRLDKNEQISVQGQIKECNIAWITLTECEIIATNLPAVSPATQEPPQRQSET